MPTRSDVFAATSRERLARNGAVLVAVEHSPARGGFTGGLARDVVGQDGYCDTCGDFVSYAKPCVEM